MPPANDDTYPAPRLRRFPAGGAVAILRQPGRGAEAEYEQLCLGGLDKGAIKKDDVVRAAEQPAGSAVDTAAEATATAATKAI